MDAALVSAATGVLKPVLGKMTTLLGDEYKRFKRVRKEIKSLTHELAAMDAFLMKMSGEEDSDMQDKVWMNEVRELSYDMEDSIDDFIQHIDDKDTKPDGFMEKSKHLLEKMGKMKARRRIGIEIQDLKKRIIEVADRNARYKTRETYSKTHEAFSNTRNEVADPRALAIFEHASKLIGIDKPKAEVIKLLTGLDGCLSEKQQLKVVTIVGSGGMGKTTLANQVYQELKEKFKCKAFVSVSRNPDMMNILRTILSEVSCQPYAHTEAGSLEQVISKISDYLTEKRYFLYISIHFHPLRFILMFFHYKIMCRYFIVIDDIWDVKTWDVIKYAFPMTICGSVIITTTHSTDVACSCRSSIGGHIYNIRPLNMTHSRQLFHRRLFNSGEECPPSLTKVSNQILKKCDGMPLAIISISGLLATRGRTENLWNQVKDSIGRALERNPSIEGMIKILSISYFDLPPHLKTCFLYLSIFPEHSVIEKKALIWRWIAEGFVQRDDRYSAYELGERYFNELVNRSLIQTRKLDKYDNVLTCRVHDAILDFIVSKSIEENFITFVGVPSLTSRTQRRVRRLSMQAEGKANCLMPTSLILSHIRSLNVFGDEVEIPSVIKFSHLRTVDFSGCHQLENHHLADVGRLFHLRYLNISRTKINELPEQIRHLRCLQMLDIRETEVYNLPACIVNLENLAHLAVGKHVLFPEGITKMQALESLKEVNACKQSCNFLQELGQLKNLKKLHISHMDVAQEHKEVFASSLGNLCTRNLCSLTTRNVDYNILGNTWCTSPPVNLQKLKIVDCVLPEVLDWILSFENLQKLCLEMELISHEHLYIFGALPALLTLSPQGRKNQFSCKDECLVVSSEAGFQCLRIFTYTVQGYRIDILFAPGCMPNLEKPEFIFF
ncbi:disease resistance protein PIK6-NP-like [Triticum dicoccoides]|uniref:disease resistance protein PIK6-NP-like n=1 Tax=Triticum dicoccoides TaxID=85692 RepID=UPI00189149BE|nr:disease resistance protein PIK6-NP-like [Triticum dicoccoides]